MKNYFLINKPKVYEHLPTRITAIQCTDETLRDCIKFIKPYNENDYTSEEFYESYINELQTLYTDKKYIAIPSNELNTKAYINNCWIIKNTNGELFIVENKIFKETYARVK